MEFQMLSSGNDNKAIIIGDTMNTLCRYWPSKVAIGYRGLFTYNPRQRRHPRK